MRVTSPSLTGLNVNPASDITPAAGIDGIQFATSGSVAVTRNLGSRKITASGSGGDGIEARSSAGGMVSVSSTGDITSLGGRGIYVKSTAAGTVSVVNSGDIRSESALNTSHAIVAVAATGTVNVNSTGAIYAKAGRGISATGTSAIAITSTGRITTTANSGLYASKSGTGTGDVSIGSIGQIVASTRGIDARTASTGSALDVHSTGAITAGTDGIRAVSSGAGAVSLTSSGNIGSGLNGLYARNTTAGSSPVKVISDGTITAQSDGIRAINSGAGELAIRNTGNIASATNRGIYAKSNSSGLVTVTNQGNIRANSSSANSHAVVAISSTGSVHIDSVGDVYAKAGEGLRAVGGTNIALTSSGDISTKLGTGLYARKTGTGAGDVVVDNHGEVSAAVLRGIDARSDSSSGAISVTSAGTITSSNDGIRGSSTGSGTVQIVNTGNVTSTDKSALVVAGRGDLSVSTGGEITGAAEFAGVEFGQVQSPGFDGATNRLEIASDALIHNGGGLGSLAIQGRSGNETVVNAGTVTGSVDLGQGLNGFDNLAGALFVMGPAVNLGAGNTLSTSGTLSPGGTGTIEAVTMSGNLQQAAGGTWVVDIDGSSHAADRINLTGTANVAGTVSVHVLSPASLRQQFTILSADGGVTDNGLSLVGELMPGGLPVWSQILHPNAHDIVLGVEVDMAVDGLNPNQAALGDYLNRVIEAGSGAATPVINALVGISDRKQYADALNQLLPEPYLQQAMAGVMASEKFSDSLLGCRRRDGKDNDTCLWAEAGGGYLDRDSTADNLGSHETVQAMGGGVETAVTADLRIGLGLRYESVSQGSGNASTDGQRAELGAALIYQPGPLLLAASVAAGETWLDTDRTLAFNGFTGETSGDQDIGLLHGRLRAGYEFDMGAAYVRPMLDLDATAVSYGGVKEDGGNGAGLRITGNTETLLSATPTVEVGGHWSLERGVMLKPFVRAGATFYSDPDLTMSSSFVDGPSGAGSFSTDAELDQVLANVSAGLDLMASDGSSLQLFYEGAFGRTTIAQGGGIRVEVSF